MEQKMTTDRRSDLGNKLSWLLIVTLVAGFSAFAWAQANKGDEKAERAITIINEDKVRIAVLEANYIAINYRLDEIRTLIKAGIH